MVSPLLCLLVFPANLQKASTPETYAKPGPPKSLPRSSIGASAWAMGVAVDLVDATPKAVFDRLGVPDSSKATNDGSVWYQEYNWPKDPDVARADRGTLEVRYTPEKRVESVKYIPIQDKINVRFTAKYFGWKPEDVFANALASTVETTVRDPRATTEPKIVDQDFYVFLPIKSRTLGTPVVALVHAKVSSLLDELREFSPSDGLWKGRYVFAQGATLESMLDKARVFEFTVPAPARYADPPLRDQLREKLAAAPWPIKD